MKRLVIGILAHVDSGKTTLSEAMLYRAGALRKLGRVDHRDAFLDTDALGAGQGHHHFFQAGGAEDWPTPSITLLDTPGHVDFSAETERTLQVLDYAILVVSGTDGVQSHTETLWRLLRAVPCAGVRLCQQDGLGRVAEIQPVPNRRRSSSSRAALSAPAKSILLTNRNTGTW